MKICLAFWGITRSLKFTIESIKKNIFNILKQNNIEYKVFIHTYNVKSLYNNFRTCENNIKLDNEEYKLLNADFISIDDQDIIKKQINLYKYRSKPDPWNTNYCSVDNFILAMYSKTKLVTLIKDSNLVFDYVIFLRPDVKYISPFNLSYLKNINDKTICVPNFHLTNGFNDRFCISNFNNYKICGDLFSKLFDFSKNNKLHSEIFQSNYIKNNGIKIINIPFYFNRVRADGREEKRIGSSEYIYINTNINKKNIKKLKKYSNASYMPKGSWIQSAKNYRIENGFLYAELRKINGQYNKTATKIIQGKKYDNINGHFS